MDEFGRKIYCFYFNGKCRITATDEETARDMFWEMLQNDQPLPDNDYNINYVIASED